MSDDVTITVRVNNQTAAGFRDVNGALRDMRGRFAADAGAMSRVSQEFQKANIGLKSTLLSLAPALVPVAAQAAPVAAGLGAAGVAAAAFTAAVIPQISTIGEAAKAHSAYEDEVKKSGATSEAAIKKQAEYQRQMDAMPRATQRAAGSYMVLSDAFKSWSDETASFTMKPVEQGLQVTTALLPRLTPLARSFSSELTRVTTVAGGAIATPGFDRMMDTFSDFTDRTLDAATDGAIHFMRVLSSGSASGPFTEVMSYARENGPAVRETLTALGEALLHVLDAASQAGPGMLTVVNAFAQLVSAVPAGLLTNLIQVYSAFKLIKLAGAGLAAVGGGVTGLATSLGALRAASVAAGGGVAGLRAAFMTLGTAAKATVVVAGITAAVLVFSKLASIGKSAPPDVDKLTTSLGKLGTSGKTSGEAARAFGSDLGGLADSLRTLSRPSNLDKTQQFLTSLVGMDSTPVKEAKEDLNAVDDALAGLVKGGKADLAGAAFDHIAAAMKKQGMSTGELRDKLGDYKSALADQAFEQQLAAESMGVFGAQAQATSEKLASQKASADGLRQSIEALNDVNRAALGGQIGFEASIDAAAKAAKANAGALNMVGGQLDLNSPKAQAAASALSDLATKTKDAATSARESGASWESVNGIYSRGRENFISFARQMGLSKTEASQLASQIMKIPSKRSTLMEMRAEDAKASLDTFIRKVKSTPNAKSVTVRALTKDAIELLRTLGYKVTKLPNGKFKVTATTGTALSNIKAVQAARDRLSGKTIVITTEQRTRFVTMGKKPAGPYASGFKFNEAEGGIVSYFANGGVRRFAGGGMEHHTAQIAPAGSMRVWAEPETGGEAYIPLSAAKRSRSTSLLADVAKMFGYRLDKYARGGITKSERAARSQARGELTLTHFGSKAGYKNTEIRNDLARPDSIGPLVSTLNQWRSTVQKSTHGGQERGLLRMLDTYGKSLIKNERSLTKVNDALDKAKSKLSDLKSAASQLSASVKSGVLSSANITKGATGEGPTTVKSIMSGLTSSRDKASAFSGALSRLKSKGVNSTLIQQIAEAGIDGGGLETAGALGGASKSEIASLNKLQSQITSSAKAAGKTTSDSVYAAQIKAAQSSVTSLTKQQDKLEKAMNKVAAAIEKSLRRAIGGKASGGIIGAASGGARGGLTWVGEHGPELTRLPFGSRVYPAHTSRRMAGDAGGAGAPLTVLLQLDGQTLARAIVDPLRGEVRRVAGGNVQRALGVA